MRRGVNRREGVARRAIFFLGLRLSQREVPSIIPPHTLQNLDLVSFMWQSFALATQIAYRSGDEEVDALINQLETFSIGIDYKLSAQKTFQKIRESCQPEYYNRHLKNRVDNIITTVEPSLSQPISLQESRARFLFLLCAIYYHIYQHRGHPFQESRVKNKNSATIIKIYYAYMYQYDPQIGEKTINFRKQVLDELRLILAWIFENEDYKSVQSIDNKLT